MPKYIDTDVLIKEYGDWYMEDDTGKGFIGNMRGFVYDVVPTVDAVEVIRCKDCIHGKIPPAEPSNVRYCCCHHMLHFIDYYCASGKHK